MIEPSALSQRYEASQQYQQQHQQRPNSGGSQKSPCPKNSVRYAHYPYSMSRSSTPCSQALGSASSTPTFAHPKIRNTLNALSNDHPTPQLTPADSGSPVTILGDDCLGDDFGNADQNVHSQHHMFVPRATRGEGEGNSFSPQHASAFSTPHRAQHTAAFSTNAQRYPSSGTLNATRGSSNYEQWTADSSLNEDDVTMNRRVLSGVASPMPEKPSVVQLPQGKPHEFANKGSLAGSEVQESSMPHDDQAYGLSKSRSARSSSTLIVIANPQPIGTADCPPLLNRIMQRERQIQLGKATLGYEHYRKTVSIERRQPDDPVTPRAASGCSKREFDRLMGEWRRTLHRYDPPTDEKCVVSTVGMVSDACGDKGEQQAMLAVTESRQANKQAKTRNITKMKK